MEIASEYTKLFFATNKYINTVGMDPPDENKDDQVITAYRELWYANKEARDFWNSRDPKIQRSLTQSIKKEQT